MSEDYGFETADQTLVPLSPVADSENSYDSFYDEPPSDYDMGVGLDDDDDVMPDLPAHGRTTIIDDDKEETNDEGDPLPDDQAPEEEDGFLQFLEEITPWLPGMKNDDHRKRLTKQWRARWRATYEEKKANYETQNDGKQLRGLRFEASGASSSSASAGPVAPIDMPATTSVDAADEEADVPDNDQADFDFDDDVDKDPYLDEIAIIQHDGLTTGTHPRLQFASPEGSRRAEGGDEVIMDDVEGGSTPTVSYNDYNLDTDSDRIADDVIDDFPAMCGTNFISGSVFDDLAMDDEGGYYDPRTRRRKRREKRERRRATRVHKPRVPLRCRLVAGSRRRLIRNHRKWYTDEMSQSRRRKRWTRKQRGWLRRILRKIKKAEAERKAAGSKDDEKTVRKSTASQTNTSQLENNLYKENVNDE